ncbi:S-adenosyl-L-methionine-dependent methyltransferase [Schizophyllum fasciatum]
MGRYLFQFAQSHGEFRIPELESMALLHGFELDFEGNKDFTRPFMVLRLAHEEHARLLARRCILIKSVHEFYAQGSTYEELHKTNRDAKPLWERYVPDTSFKFEISGFNHTIPKARQRDVVESFGYMDMLGKIDLKNPEIVMTVYEECAIHTDKRRDDTPRDKLEGDGKFLQVYFGRLVQEGSARLLIHKFDVKKRAFFGNTSMEAEISLLMANQTMASAGKVMYDPFMGTGSMAYPVAHFGAMMFGSDIDGRQMRGKGAQRLPGKTPGVYRAAEQYGVGKRIMDLCTFDMAWHPWRRGGLFDAIVTDPPYGVRAGAKRLGRKKEMTEERRALHSERQAALKESGNHTYIPPTRPYELSELARDLVQYARYMLKPEGRLVFFLPTVNEHYQEVDVQMMLCPGMELVANSLQDFGAWGRRLITVRKSTHEEYPAPDFLAKAPTTDTEVPAHKDFREKYFEGFRKGDEKSPASKT